MTAGDFSVHLFVHEGYSLRIKTCSSTYMRYIGGLFFLLNS
jgi:hypothetical protein